MENPLESNILKHKAETEKRITECVLKMYLLRKSLAKIFDLNMTKTHVRFSKKKNLLNP